MDEEMESGGTFEEPGTEASDESLASGSIASGASREEPRQPISIPPSSLGDQIEALNAHIEETIEKKFQRGKDKRMARIENEIQALNQKISDLKMSEKNSAPPEAAPNDSVGKAAAADFSPHAPSSVPSARASHLIQPSGGGAPARDLRNEYERRVADLRLGDIAGLMELKREFRKRGLEVY